MVIRMAMPEGQDQFFQGNHPYYGGSESSGGNTHYLSDDEVAANALRAEERRTLLEKYGDCWGVALGNAERITADAWGYYESSGTNEYLEEWDRAQRSLEALYLASDTVRNAQEFVAKNSAANIKALLVSAWFVRSMAEGTLLSLNRSEAEYLERSNQIDSAIKVMDSEAVALGLPSLLARESELDENAQQRREVIDDTDVGEDVPM